uniref:GTP:AMP phosphotransferase AK3, mitochondrial n=1 Tax=Petromyzon marinus TaxID=7757 RepID=A0AAJ7T6H1_PETMA|nr:GTP:AMP phosphotransferase AK3, mitochondrial [Petromyzon marinus]XP_032812261.1 GTP:AMP phosphotransferase AK3, mitochondrial [Petromyzon marinus]
MVVLGSRALALRAVLLGPPGSGKGTVASRIRSRFGLQTLSTGDLVRDHIARKTEIGVLAKECVLAGRLVPDEIITELTLTEIKAIGERGWLLDGFPRTVSQARALSDRYPLGAAINLDVPFATITERLTARWTHPGSGRVYNTHFNPPRKPGVDDETGEPLVQRVDDRPETVTARLKEYSARTEPVLIYYGEKGLLHSFTGTETDVIWPHIDEFLATRIPPLK